MSLTHERCCGQHKILAYCYPAQCWRSNKSSWTAEGRLQAVLWQRLRPPKHASRSRSSTVLRASGKDDLDIAVFRFTLGIPGFDDGLIPRVLGYAGLLILLINRLASQSVGDSSQVRAEVIGGILAGLCIAVPSIGKQLQESSSGKGRKKSSGDLLGAKEIFKLADNLNDELKRELAWSSFALLKNTNTAGVLISSGKKILAARGAVKSVSNNGLQSLEQSWQGPVSQEPDFQESYFPDQGTVNSSQFAKLVPEGAQSLLAYPIQCENLKNVYLLSWASLPRAFSRRDRQWTANIAKKLSTIELESSLREEVLQ